MESFFLFEKIHFFVLLLLIYFTSASLFSNNYVYSVLFLILAFFDSAFILFMFDIEFLALLFIMVYVGAVAILFLFVIMMIETKKIIDFKFKASKFLIFLSILVFFLLSESVESFFSSAFFNRDSPHVISYYFKYDLLLFDEISNISYIGKTLFNVYFVSVLISGFILIVALLGSMSLTLNFKNKTQNKSKKQLSRDYLNSINLFNLNK